MIEETMGRRRKAVPISQQLLTELFTQGNTIHARCVRGLPEGARFVAEAYDAVRDTHYLIFESESWDLVPYFQSLPEFLIEYSALPQTWNSTSTEGASWAMEGAHGE